MLTLLDPACHFVLFSGGRGTTSGIILDHRASRSAVIGRRPRDYVDRGIRADESEAYHEKFVGWDENCDGIIDLK